MCGGKQRGQGRNRAIHQPGQTGLNDLQHKQSLLPVGFLLRECRARDAPGDHHVTALLFGQVAEQLANPGIRGAPRRHLVETLGFEFNGFGGFFDYFFER